MTERDYERYTGASYTASFKDLGAAIRCATNEHNLGKVKVIMLADGETYGVTQNSIANKLIAAGLEQVRYGLEALGPAE
jgi:hypothetical protein